MCVCMCAREAESARGGACCLTAVLLGGSRFSPCSTLLLLARMINAGKGWNVGDRPGIRIPLQRPHLLHAFAPPSPVRRRGFLGLSLEAGASRQVHGQKPPQLLHSFRATASLPSPPRARKRKCRRGGRAAASPRRWRVQTFPALCRRRLRSCPRLPSRAHAPGGAVLLGFPAAVPGAGQGNPAASAPRQPARPSLMAAAGATARLM